ncbi:hypothetical protein PQX77_021018 [Marasmius sp. AFHP31]|nr:hypothetical protein PQX77_021018 [Marasmius sp. AFHP31]
MDDLFGNSGSDEISSYNDNGSDNGVKECPDNLGVPYDNKSQGEPDKWNGDSSTYTADWNQYGYGDDRSLSNYLALTPQNLPQLLWSLQFPKPTHIRPPKLNVLSRPTGMLSIDFLLLETLAALVPFFDILAVFEPFIYTTNVVFL